MSKIGQFLSSILRRMSGNKSRQLSLPLKPTVLIDAVRKTIQGAEKSWVLFEKGTIVILMEPQDDLIAQASDLLKQWGPVHAGSPSGDFAICTLHNGLGWTILCHHPDILTFVGKEEVAPGTPDLPIGLLGHNRRDADAAELRVIHVEDRRSPVGSGSEA